MKYIRILKTSNKRRYDSTRHIGSLPLIQKNSRDSQKATETIAIALGSLPLLKGKVLFMCLMKNEELKSINNYSQSRVIINQYNGRISFLHL